LKPEFAIVTVAAEPMAWLSETSRAAWQRLSCERVVVTTAGESADANGILTVAERDGLFADWMRQHAAAAVIVRPDRYVFGAAGSADELNMLVGRLLQNLSAGRQAFQGSALSVPPEERDSGEKRLAGGNQ
jgi:3-(3-hydroxy-phenyl)propionate hydroxylase